MINVIVPMCGVSQRFTDADYTVPKYVLDVNGVPMYAASVNSLKLSIEHQLYFVVNVKSKSTNVIMKSELIALVMNSIN